MKVSKVDEEIQSLQLDKPGAGKSASQLQKHTIDEQYTNKPIERSLYILTRGDDLQKLSVIQSLPDFLNTDNNATLSRIIPKIQQELPNSSSEFQIATSQMFRLFIEMKVPLNLLRPVLQGIESKDPVVAGAWVETLTAVIRDLPESMLRNEVLPYCLKLSQMNRSIFYRVWSCKILSQISSHPKMNAYDIKKDILPYVQSLCQDCLYEVRAAMCNELPLIVKSLGNDSIVKSNILPCLTELSNDDNIQVRASSIESIVLIMPFLPNDTIKSTVIPLQKKLCCQSSVDGDLTYPIIAKLYGEILTNLTPQLSHGDSIWFLDFYKQLSLKGLHPGRDEELDIEPVLFLKCRENCASNLPSTAIFVLHQIPSEYKKWEKVFKELTEDPCYLVRKAVAGCVHEIVVILGRDCHYILSDIIKLLRDDSEEVLEPLIPNIGKILDVLTQIGILSRDLTTQGTLEISRALLKCQVEVFKCHNWRRKLVYLQQLEQLHSSMPSDFIHQHFTPVVLKLILETKAKPVRLQGCRTILKYLRFSIKENHRKWIRDNLINLLCHSECCYTRNIFIHLCSQAMEMFSWKYFKEHFYMHLLSLGDDPVSNIRLGVVNLCPALKQILILPVDRNLQIKLENLVSKIEIMEKNKDVIQALKTKLKEMRTMQSNKQEALFEEKRKLDEEEKIGLGRLTASTLHAHKLESYKGRRQSSSLRTAPIILSRSNSSRQNKSSASRETSAENIRRY